MEFASPTVAPFYHASPRVLLVEDDLAHADLLEATLREAGTDPMVTFSPEAALELCTEADYDLCIVDLRMLNLSGPRWVEEVKLRQPSMPCILLLGPEARDLPLQILNSGADGFLQKPVDLDPLQLVMERLLLKRYLLKEREQLEGAHQALRAFRHELAQPLEQLLQQSESVVRRCDSDPGLLRAIAEIRISGTRLLEMMDRLDTFEFLHTEDSPTGPMLRLPTRA